MSRSATRKATTTGAPRDLVGLRADADLRPHRGHALTRAHLRAHADALCVWRSRISLCPGVAAMRANRLRHRVAHPSRRRVVVCAHAFCPLVAVYTVPSKTLHVVCCTSYSCVPVCRNIGPDGGGAQCSAQDDPRELRRRVADFARHRPGLVVLFLESIFTDPATLNGTRPD